MRFRLTPSMTLDDFDLYSV